MSGTPSRPGRGVSVVQHRRAGGADRLVHLRDLPDQVLEPLILRDLAAGLLQLRPQSQVHRPRPAAHGPGQVPLRPVAGMVRGRACAVRLAALAADLVQRPPPEVPDLPQLREKLPPEDTDRVQIGSRVEVFFDDLPDTEVTLPRFRLT